MLNYLKFDYFWLVLLMGEWMSE